LRFEKGRDEQNKNKNSTQISRSRQAMHAALLRNRNSIRPWVGIFFRSL